MSKYRLQKTDSVVNMSVGRRIVYYAPELDLCFIKNLGWAQVDCPRDWTKVKDTNYTIEWR